MHFRWCGRNRINEIGSSFCPIGCYRHGHSGCGRSPRQACCSYFLCVVEFHDPVGDLAGSFPYVQPEIAVRGSEDNLCGHPSKLHRFARVIVRSNGWWPHDGWLEMQQPSTVKITALLLTSIQLPPLEWIADFKSGDPARLVRTLRRPTDGSNYCARKNDTRGASPLGSLRRDVPRARISSQYEDKAPIRRARRAERWSARQIPSTMRSTAPLLSRVGRTRTCAPPDSRSGARSTTVSDRSSCACTR